MSRGIAGMHTEIEGAVLPELSLEQLEGAFIASARLLLKVVRSRYSKWDMATHARRMDNTVATVFHALDIEVTGVPTPWI